MECRSLFVAVLLLLAGCTVPGPTPPSGSASTSSSSPQASAATASTPTPSALATHTPTQPYDLGSVNKVERAAATQTLTGADPKYPALVGWVFQLSDAARIAPDRVLVRGWVNADKGAATQKGFEPLTEPGYKTFGSGEGGQAGAMTMAGDFSNVVLSVPGDQTQYLPVRDAGRTCACLRFGWNRPAGDTPVYVVMSAPQNATSVTLSIPGLGTMAHVPVAATATQNQPPSPLASGFQLRVASAERTTAGVVSTRLELERPGLPWEPPGINAGVLQLLSGANPWNGNGTNTIFHFLGLSAVANDAKVAGYPALGADGVCTGCSNLGIQLPAVGQGLEVTLDVVDPGSASVDLYPTTGWPILGIPVGGAAPATRGQAAVDLQTRTRIPGATMNGSAEVNLDTSVLFDYNSDKLNGKASDVLAKVAAKLKDVQGRKLSVVGHTDSSGTSAYNLDLSKRRAQAVQTALAPLLGAGWTFAVSGVGDTLPLVGESGLSGDDLATAQQLNRRVELQVAS